MNPNGLIKPTLQSVSGYRIDSLLAKNGDTVIYRALKGADGPAVLLKTTKTNHSSPTETRRLKHEYDTIRLLKFDGHVKAVGLERHDQRTVLVLHDPGCPTLTTYLSGRSLDLDEYLRIAIRTAQLVAAMHRSDVIHCGVRPDNLLIDEAGERVWIMGFELAILGSRREPEVPDAAETEAALPYMSPEQTGRTHRNVDHRTDLYALGVTFYEMLTGTPPFRHEDPADLIHAHVAQRPQPPVDRRPDLPAAVSRIVMKLLAKDPEDRYQSAHGLKADLDKCLLRLQTTGSVEPFRLGEHDIADKIRIGDILYGRERETAILMRSFEKTCVGSSEIMLVYGAPGIGKTALVVELRMCAAQRGGYFVEGKFDEMQQSVPYSALVQVCRDLIRQILTESDEAVSNWRENILSEMRSIVQVIIDVVPELALIVGAQPPIPSLSPIESLNRFNLAWQKFLGIFAREARPLVIFLDDLQWADSATLSLIQNSMAEARTRHLMLVGAYRERDVGPSHPLQITVQALEEKGAAVTHLHIPPLGRSEIASLLSDALHVDADAATALGNVLLTKTHGNPLALIETLKLLHRRELLQFNADRHSWMWDLAQIRTVEVSENVVDLLVDKIRQLEPSTRSVLTLAACIGNTFDLHTLSTVSGQSRDATIADLTPALNAGLIRFASGVEMLSHPGGSGDDDANAVLCRFLHDRVQQAAYALIDEEERPGVHLHIGRALRSAFESMDFPLRPAGSSEVAIPQERLFHLANHLNRGAALLESETERTELARLNLEACRKAKAATAFEVALGFARAGLELVAPSHWESWYELMLGLHLERAECDYLNGHFEAAEAQCDHMLERVRTDSDRVLVFNVRIMLYTSQSRYADAVREGVAAARLLGLSLPDKPGQVHIIREFMQARWNLRGMKTQDLMNLPSMVDSRQLETVSLLMNLIAPAFLSSETFAILISLKLFNISLKHGLSKATPYGYMVYAVVNAGLGRIKKASEFGEMALRLCETLPHVEKGHILPFLFATAVNHWTAPASTNVDYLLQSYRASLDAGDLLYADYCLITIVVNTFFKGDSLDIVLDRCDRYLDFCARVKGSANIDTAQRQAETIQRQHVRCLQGRTRGSTSLSDDQFDEESFLSQSRAPLVMLEYYTKKLQLLYLFDDFSRLPALIEQSAEVIEKVKITGDIRVSEHVFYEALILAALPPTRRRRKALRTDRQLLKKWAESCPPNFSHKHWLVEAEVARATGKERRAMDFYDAAAEAAVRHEFTHINALANERAARFYAGLSKDSIARTYAAASRYGYLQWGASTKVAGLDDMFGPLDLERLTSEGPNRTTFERVDLTSVARASQALSEEIVLDRLLERMGAIVIANAGAEKGYLILDADGRLVVEAKVAVDADEVRLAVSEPIEHTDLVPKSVVHYVMRTRETVVLDDASRKGLFVGDPYVVNHRPRSVLCLPLSHQGRVTGALYLENNLAAGVFTPARLELLQLLSGQLSISIENARLYGSLERKVAERTNQLKMKNADLESAMRHLKETQAQLIQAEKMASLGQLTAGIAHEIKNPLNFINNFASLTVDLITELEEEADTKPDLRLEDIRDLIDVLKLNVGKIEEHGRRSDGIVRSMLEHSRATHGERAPTDLNALLRESVRLAIHSMRARDSEFEVEVEWKLDEGLSRLDVVPQEVSRVLLNLLANALYAVRERRAQEGSKYTPALLLVSKADHENVEIRIADNGTGIPDKIRDEIFKPFYTTKPPGEGTGLGLSLSYDIITRSYGGSLLVEHSDGDGATFVVRLPMRTQVHSLSPSAAAGRDDE